MKKEKGCCFVFIAYLNIPSLAPKFDQLAPLNASQGSSKSKSSAFLKNKALSSSMHNSYNNAVDDSHHSTLSSKYYQPKKTNSAPPSRSSSQISYGDSGGGSGHSRKHKHKSKQSYYALKSIHLDRCTTPEYVKELRNEVDILKCLGKLMKCAMYIKSY